MRSNAHPAIVIATAAVFAITSLGVAPAFAAPRASKGEQAATAAATDFSSRRRHRSARNNAAAAAAIAAIVGGIATYAAAREYRKARERELQYRYGGYGYHPHYYHPRKRYYRHW